MRAALRPSARAARRPVEGCTAPGARPLLRASAASPASSSPDPPASPSLLEPPSAPPCAPRSASPGWPAGCSAPPPAGPAPSPGLGGSSGMPYSAASTRLSFSAACKGRRRQATSATQDPSPQPSPLPSSQPVAPGQVRTPARSRPVCPTRPVRGPARLSRRLVAVHAQQHHVVRAVALEKRWQRAAVAGRQHAVAQVAGGAGGGASSGSEEQRGCVVRTGRLRLRCREAPRQYVVRCSAPGAHCESQPHATQRLAFECV
jgi:hypothetical protein